MSHDTGDRMQRELFGLPVDALTMDQAIARCTGAIDHGEQLSIGVINAAKVVSMQRNPKLRQAVAVETNSAQSSEPTGLETFAFCCGDDPAARLLRVGRACACSGNVVFGV